VTEEMTFLSPNSLIKHQANHAEKTLSTVLGVYEARRECGVGKGKVLLWDL